MLATYSVDVQTDTSPFERLLSIRNVVPKAKYVLQASILSSSLCSQTLEQQKLLVERATEAMATGTSALPGQNNLSSLGGTE